jgi:hypothetical protein
MIRHPSSQPVCLSSLYHTSNSRTRRTPGPRTPTSTSSSPRRTLTLLVFELLLLTAPIITPIPSSLLGLPPSCSTARHTRHASSPLLAFPALLRAGRSLPLPLPLLIWCLGCVPSGQGATVHWVGFASEDLPRDEAFAFDEDDVTVVGFAEEVGELVVV